MSQMIHIVFAIDTKSAVPEEIHAFLLLLFFSINKGKATLQNLGFIHARNDLLF